jgi:hypothetical protein
VGAPWKGDLKPEESISAAIKLSRLADMCGVTGVDAAVTEYI